MFIGAKFRKCYTCGDVFDKHNNYSYDEWNCDSCNVKFGNTFSISSSGSFHNLSHTSPPKPTDSNFTIHIRPTSCQFGNLLFLDYYGFLATYGQSNIRSQLATSNEQWPPSSEWLLQHMELEWKSPELLQHWTYVMEAVPYATNLRMWEGNDRDSDHQGYSINDFLNHSFAKKANLKKAEVIALRIYTGPAYNIIRPSQRTDHQFDVTIYCINSAICKLGMVNLPPSIVLRGIQGELSEHIYTQGSLSQSEVNTDNTQQGAWNCKLHDCFITERDIISSLDAPPNTVKGDALLAIHTSIPTNPNTIATSPSASSPHKEFIFDRSFSYFESEPTCNQIFRDIEQSLKPNVIVCKPAPISWISQLSTVGEWAWPLGTGILLLPHSYHRVKLNRPVLEGVGFYLWDSHHNCPSYFEVPLREKMLLQLGLSKWDLEAINVMFRPEVSHNLDINDVTRLIFMRCDSKGLNKLNKYSFSLFLEQIPSSLLGGDKSKTRILSIIKDKLPEHIDIEKFESFFTSSEWTRTLLESKIDT
eukprot:NODE_2146_length_1672_cov_35.915429_g1835_i0.p1 GENE.NODE_2146_length_1672_cov_35.915429_g1835_i0~~NODE_2146_length_1672_cov_35.915429_g1835_i0.p1  ORF type:complete len:548 (+),score=93.35 NODE_2146_length_1672_cov_35.915429_g1835_i0:56-1645(+)